MKIIGLTGDDWDSQYIATVSHSELERYLGLYYVSDKDKLKHLKVGDAVDLGKAHDYTVKIADAMRKTQEFVKANQEVVTAILNGLNYQRIAEDAAKANTEAAS